MEVINYKRIFTYVFLSYSLCFIMFEFSFGLLNGKSDLLLAVLTFFVMFTPAVFAVFTNKIWKEKWSNNLGLKFNFSYWYLIAAVLPVLIILLSIFISTLFPGVEITDGFDFMRSEISKELPPSQVDLAMNKITSISPYVLYSGMALAGIFAGSLFNVFPALGEEIGWRGFLQSELKPLGFWKSSFLVGLVWGLWHTPLIIRGYNYPKSPYLGLLMMTLITIFFSPIMYYLKEKSKGSVIPASIFHGVNNAIAVLPVILLTESSNLVIGMTGLAGLGSLILFNVIIYIDKSVNFNSP